MADPVSMEVLEFIFLTCVDVIQDLELGVEEEHRLGAGSQPRAWGKTSAHIFTQKLP